MSGGASPVKAWKWVGRTAIAAVVLGLVLAGLLAFVVPGIAITRASRGMEAATGRKLAVGALSIHPFTWQGDKHPAGDRLPRINHGLGDDQFGHIRA